jgi:hypothetical protein
MAQSAATVTPPNPTPPTNMSFTGATPPNVPNYTKNTYNDPKNWSSVNPKDFPPPYFDDGSAGSLVAFATNTAALASGSGATGGGGEGTYPGAGSGTTVNNVGAVPASSSAAHEGAGTEVVVTASVPNPSPNGQLQTVSDLGSFTNSPNGAHASNAMFTATPTITGAPAPNNTASGVGTVAITLTGTNYTRASQVYIDGVAYTTNYVSATSLTVANAPKKPTAGTRSVTVQNGFGGPTSSASTWTFT